MAPLPREQVVKNLAWYYRELAFTRFGRRSIIVHVEGPYHVSMKQAGLMKGKSKKQLREEGLL